MIKRVKLENFRRHADTEILFGDEQVIVVAGKNGSGKSTILEGIIYGLYGVSRNGNRQLDHLVRRGAEFDGMGVEVDFLVGDDTYKVVRRRDNGVASAVLYVNDIALVEGNRDVTDAVSSTLGMDAAGFRLAAVAQQKELDAILKLGATGRVKAMNRLLRLDAVGRARSAIADEYKTRLAGINALPDTIPAHQLASDIALAESRLATAAASESSCRAEIARLELALTESTDVDAEYRASYQAAADATAHLNSAKTELARLNAERALIEIPDEVHLASDIEALRAASQDAFTAFTRAESVAVLVEQAAATKKDLAAVQDRIAEIVEQLGSDDGATVERRVSEFEREHADALKNLTLLQDADNAARVAVSTAERFVQERQRLVDATVTLNGMCDSCGQEIADEHREQQLRRREDERDAAIVELNARMTERASTSSALAAGQSRVAAASHNLDQANKRLMEVFNLQAERDTCKQRERVYEQRLQRIDVDPVDVAALKDTYLAANNEMMHAETAAEQQRNRQDALAAIEKIDARIAAAAQAVETAESAVAEKTISEELQARWEQRRIDDEAHRNELAMLSALTTSVSDMRGEVTRLSEAARHNAAIDERRHELTQQGRIAGLAKQLLVDVETRLGHDVRPNLERLASDIITTLSDGRFSALKLSDDFAPRVDDSGVWRGVNDLSGGEGDLVALAMRLAIAEVVTERNDGSLNMVILDEVLGSQDSQRRESVMGTLQGLRNRYSQIWCISHVGGIEDLADIVIEVEVDNDGVAHVG